MADIQLISTSSVKAASHKECSTHERIDLTPWDLQLLLLGPIQKGLLFHKPKTTQDQIREYSSESSIIQHLRTSLSRTLDFFNPLAGRLVSIQNDDNSTSYFIDCNNAGAQFVHATTNDVVTIADILEPVYVPDRLVHSFFPLNGVQNCEGTSKPLLGVQVTELVDGIFIGCTLNHAVADGTSFWHFFNSWSEISRVFNQISKLPALRRWFLDGTDCPIRIPPQKLSDSLTLLSMKERIFHFTKEKITELKAKANAEIGMTNRVSSLQAVLTHFWRSVIRSQNLDPNQKVSFNLLIGARTRLQPPLPENYFGNAVLAGTVTVKAGDLLEGGLGHAAWEMNKMVALHTGEKVRSFLESWVESPRILTFGSLTSHALGTSSSPRFNVYGNDFGWGRPVAVRSGSANKTNGKVTVFPAVEEGGIDIEACLPPETLKAMGNDSEFMDAVTSN
ncbi:uncharacterized acetyltransferase At3g50280-like [Carya illinoinensis]|uniref:Uncharacterized protein n=1 Tax=Carya illinoinensis TaxID=32201 RepID=A0A8T1RAY9_CARIL|nr:uncharacterized acetyltransferase At3g50280-like [Carya illinoinensis]KAG6663161.1 hypothetical protein CIPAW_02G007400 [Carya illinoinensis]